MQDAGVTAFSLPAPDLQAEQRRAFAVGNAFFRDNWVIAPASTAGRDGLGPLFNARSCSGCHLHDGRGRPALPEEERAMGLVLRLSMGSEAHPIYGGQLQDLANPGIQAEARIQQVSEIHRGRYADGSAYSLEQLRYEIRQPAYGAVSEQTKISPRMAPHLVGMGLLEAIPVKFIQAQADPEDLNGDGISGRVNRVWDIRRQQDALGRFGWKAGQPSVEQQVAAAFSADIGITSSLFPDEVPTAQQDIHVVSGGQPELDDHKLGRVTFYCQALAVPAQRHAQQPEVLRGEVLFQSIGCNQCHLPQVKTGKYAAIPAFSNMLIRPYTDLLLHDMGPELADQRPEGKATGQEWRTPPLWGIGLFPAVSNHSRYLHDGRARNLAEAILWHGGEGQAARDAFKALEKTDREALVAFLQSL